MIFHYPIYTIVIVGLILYKSIKSANAKCIIVKDSVNCFGSTWKQDLLPIENDSLQKLTISKCSKSNQYSNTFDISFIKNLLKLKLLSITNCELKRPPIIQYQIYSVEIINLSNNFIDEKSQFDALGMNFFKRFQNLKILDLSHNRLKDLPKNWFDCSNVVEVLILNDNLISGLDPYLSSCFPNLKQLYLRNNQFIILKKSSELKLLSNNIDRGPLGLEISGEPRKIQSQNPSNVRHKAAKRTTNKRNYNNIIPQFSSLEILDLAFNKIHSLDQIPLLNLQNLTNLILRGNRLSSFSDINSLENKCDFGTAPFYINGKTGLNHLDLSDNIGLTRIHSCWTFGLPNLQILKISNCSINLISESSFEKMKMLIKIDLSHNQLNEVSKELTMVSSTLAHLNLANNNISQLRSGNLIHLENLRTLNLSHNQFENFLTFSPSEPEIKLQDNNNNFQPSNDSPDQDEPIGLLSRMNNLRDLDFSFNNLIKISAATDLSPSMKLKGSLQQINLVGNRKLSQLLDFNYKEITPTLSRFYISNQSELNCNCQLNGFIEWIAYRNIEVKVNCGSPEHLAGQLITNNIVRDSIKSCGEKSQSKIIKPIYRLKLSSNSNRTSDNLVDMGPMNGNIKKPVSNNKRQNDYQRWAIINSNLTLRCEFYSSHQTIFEPQIEWQRTRVIISQPIPFNRDHNPSNSHLFLKTDDVDRLETVKPHEKTENLNNYYDTRIKTFQIGPLDDKLDLDKFGYSLNSDFGKNLTIKFSGKPYKYASYLQIKPIYKEDFGRYRCLVNELPVNQFYIQSQLISKEEEIKVFTPPTFTATPSSIMSIIEEETAEITCRATGYPIPSTSLGRIGSKNFPAAQGQRMVIFKDDSTFFITKVRQVDTGNYSCTSRNPAGIISYNFTLKVQIPATFVETAPKQIKIAIGEPLIIKYKINGVPLPSVQWFKDGHKLVGDDRISFSANQLMFVVSSCIPEDSGSYKISILNALGGNEATVSVRILESSDISNKLSIPTPPSQYHNTSKEMNWVSDYWLSAIIIIVVLSILLTSILWITIFLCFGKLMMSKKRRLLLISNSQSKSSFDKCLTSTTNFSNLRSIPSNVCHIPLSLTTSTIVRHDQSREECHEIADSDLATESLKTCSEFYSPQISRVGFPEMQSTYSISNHMFHSQPYLSSSKQDLSHINKSVSRNNHITMSRHEPCDSGIDSSHIYSETLNSSDISSIYKCRHKSKHKTNNLKRKRHQNNINSSGSSEALKSSSGEVIKPLTISDEMHNDKTAQAIAITSKDYLTKQCKSKKMCNQMKNCSTPLLDTNFALQCG